MVTTAISPAPGEQEPEAKISAMGRVFGVLFSPKATFEDIVRKPSWIVPVVILILLGTGVGVVLSKKVDWSNYVRQQAEKNPQFAQLPEDQKQQRLEISTKIASISTPFIGVIAVPILLLIVTLVYWIGFNVFSGASLPFSRAWAIVCYAYVPSAFASIITMIILSLKRFGDVDPQRMAATNLAAFLSNDAAHWLTVLGGFVDIFAIWVLILMSIGFSVANPRKISKGAAYGTVFGLWALFVVIRVGIAAL
jgi:hypothetical protein